MQIDVQHNAARSRFEAHVEGQLGMAAYRLEDRVMAIVHTEVPRAFERRGIASALAEAALAYARENGYKVDPRCAFVRGYMQRHPETQSLHV
jgi:uncharacterized protein